MDIVFTQTADGDAYLDLMQATSRTVRAYCARHGCVYEAFVGVKRGWWPWQASFNRIYLLEELVARGRFDWAVYLDADAYVADLRFDVRRYLRRKARFAAVMTPSGSTRQFWDVNDGVLMVNLRHPFTARMLQAWRKAYEAVPDATLRAQTTWSNPDDQEMIQAFLRDDPDAARYVHLAPRKLVNSAHARFIQQMVRAFFPDADARLRTVKARVDEILSPDFDHDPVAARAAAVEVVDWLYRAVLRRSADPGGVAHFAPLIQALGFEAGSRLLVDAMIGSEEYRGRSDLAGRAETASPAEPSERCVDDAGRRACPNDLADATRDARIERPVGVRTSGVVSSARALFPDMEARLRATRARVHKRLGSALGFGSEAQGRASAAESVDMLYRAVLRRGGDPEGIDCFAPLIEAQGFEAGARIIIDAMMRSDEFRTRRLT